MLEMYRAFPFVVCFDGDGDGDGSGDGSGEGEGEGEGSGNGAETRTFTQDELNKILAEEKRKQRAQSEKIEKQLKDTLASAKLSQDERAKLDDMLEDVRKQMRSKEEQAKFEKKKLEEEHSTRISDLEARLGLAETRYKDTIIDRALMDAAVTGDAFNPAQVVTLLKPHVKIVDDKPMIDFPDFSEDEKREPITTQRTAEDAIKRMKQLPDIWGNLFKSNVVAGVGGSSVTGDVPSGPNGRYDLRKLDGKKYLELRNKDPKALGLGDK